MIDFAIGKLAIGMGLVMLFAELSRRHMYAKHRVSDAVYLCSSLGGVVFSGFKRPSERQSDMWKRRQGLQTWFLDFALPFGLGVKGRWESLASCAPEHILDRVKPMALLNGK